MKITVKVRPNSKEEKVLSAGKTGYVLHVKEPAKEGRANRGIVKLLSAYLKVPKSRIVIVRGLSSKSKVVEIN